MSVPGLNILGLALTAIASQPVMWYPWLGSSTTVDGMLVPYFDGPQPVPVGSVQAVPRTRYASMGLDYTKDYVTWFTPAPVRGVERDRAPDQFTWGGRRFDVTAVTAWSAQDGWSEVVGVDIGPASSE